MDEGDLHEVALPSASPSTFGAPTPRLSSASSKQYILSTRLPEPSVPPIFLPVPNLPITCDKALKCSHEEEIILPLPKADFRMGRVSPVSVDSGFESSFPSSPESSSSESRNLLLQKLDIPSARLISLEKNCKPGLMLGCRASVIHIAPPSDMVIEGHVDFSGELPDVVLAPDCKRSDLPKFVNSLEVGHEGSIEKHSLRIPSVNVTDQRNSEYSNNTGDAATVLEQEILIVEEKEDCSSFADLTIKAEECCELPSTSTASSTYYTPSTPQSIRDDEECESLCLWEQCGQQFTNELELLDHVMQSHFDCFHPLEDTDMFKRIRNGAKVRTRNFSCKWDTCKMGLGRGDWKKQLSWLKEHFFTRHLRKAKPYCCLIDGCSARFSSKRALEDHLSSGHDDKAKKTEVGRKKKPKVESCLEWTPLPYYPPDPKNDFLDKATIEFMVMRLRKYEGVEGPQFVPRPPPGPRGGAAYRKRKRVLTWDIIPFEEFLKQELERKKREILNGVPQVGEFAAEEWKKIFQRICT